MQIRNSVGEVVMCVLIGSSFLGCFPSLQSLSSRARSKSRTELLLFPAVAQFVAAVIARCINYSTATTD